MAEISNIIYTIQIHRIFIHNFLICMPLVRFGLRRKKSKLQLHEHSSTIIKQHPMQKGAKIGPMIKSKYQKKPPEVKTIKPGPEQQKHIPPATISTKMTLKIEKKIKFVCSFYLDVL